MIGLFSISVYGFEYQKRENLYLETRPNDTFFGQNLYESNRYAQKETIIIHNFDSTIDPAFAKIGDDEDLELFYDMDTYRFIVRQKQSGYLWHSYARDLELEQLNSTMRSLLSTPFYIEYFPYNESTEKLSTTTRREILSNINIESQSISNGIKLSINYARLNIQFELHIYLEDNQLVAYVPNETIIENNNLLHTIQILPNFGSTRGVDVPGYILIPDGPGALYRFKDNALRPVNSYVSKYYGSDNGIRIEQNTNPLNQMTLPILGMVHGIDQNAFIAVIEKGDSSANFTMSPSGANGLNFNLTSAQFILRESYVFPTNLKGDGIPTVIQDKYSSDLKVNYLFTSQDQANYIGLANRYQSYLVERGELAKSTEAQTNIRLEFLHADTKRGLFGYEKVVMTTFKDAKTIIDQLLDQQIEMTVVSRGWNRSGFSGQMPYHMDYDNSLGNTSGYKDLQAFLADNQISSYLYADYIKTYNQSSRINERDDFARGVYRRIIERNLNSIVYSKEYYLNPTTTAQLLIKDQAFYQNSGSKMALDSTNMLFSYYQKGQFYDRNNSINQYQESLDSYERIALYMPNAYMFKYMDKYFDIPLYNAQYTFYDDTIPFLSTVLKGYIDIYAPFQNFFATSTEQTLMLVDFGIYPSYIITKEETHLLKYTQANRFFSTSFNTWENDIITTYNHVSQALDLVVGQKIRSRVVLETGVVKTTYENGIYFVINYTDLAFNDGYQVAPKSYIIGGQS